MIENIVDTANRRTIISAAYPRRFEDNYTDILLKVWFEELSEPIELFATPFDCERHTKELWIRAMAGEFGPIEVIPHRLNGAIPSVLIDENNVSHISIFMPQLLEAPAVPLPTHEVLEVAGHIDT